MENKLGTVNSDEHGVRSAEVIDRNDIPSAVDVQTQALGIRRQWMLLMGLSEDEIREACGPEHGPFNLSEELTDLEAALEFQQNRLTAAELSQLGRDGGSQHTQS